MGLLSKLGGMLMPGSSGDVGGRFLGLNKGARKGFAPKQQYWGGSKDASDAARARYLAGEKAGGKQADQGVARGNRAAETASGRYDDLRTGANTQQTIQQGEADYDRRRGLGAGNDYQAGRGATLANAGKLEQMGDNAAQDYQRTAQVQFRNQQDANQRQALALGTSGGPSGLRAALASSTLGNAQAAQQAQVTQAQEQNNILSMRQNAYGQAAGIRQGVGGQDLGAMGQYGQQAESQRNAAIQQQGVQGNAISGTLAGQQNAAALGAQTGTAARGQYLGAQAAQGNAELNAGREYEGQRQQNEKYNYTQDYYPLKRFNAPA